MSVSSVTAPGALMGLALTSHLCKDVRAGLRSLEPKPNRQDQGSNTGQKWRKK